MEHTIVHFEIPADDPERASKFYSDLFGWTIEKDTSIPGIEYWMIKTSDREGVLNGGLMRRMAPGQQIGNYVGVESIDQYTARATQLGAEVVVPKMEVPGVGWLAHLKDPEGNMIALFESTMHHDG